MPTTAQVSVSESPHWPDWDCICIRFQKHSVDPMVGNHRSTPDGHLVVLPNDSRLCDGAALDA